MEWVQFVTAHPIFQGALAGFISAASIDYAAFRKWQSFGDAKKYDWGIASFRWVQGAVVGAVTSLGLQALA